MATKVMNISLPVELVTELDELAKRRFVTRSDLLRTAAQQYVDADKALRELFRYGKTLAQANAVTEAEVADTITQARRSRESWRRVAA